MTEAAWLLRRDLNAVQKLLNSMDTGFVALLPLGTDDAKPIASIMKKYRDIRIQLADAALVHLAARDGLDTIFTLDHRDFSVYRLPRGRTLRLLPIAL
jgi:predicted nucleic acid-binding protein